MTSPLDYQKACAPTFYITQHAWRDFVSNNQAGILTDKVSHDCDDSLIRKSINTHNKKNQLAVLVEDCLQYITYYFYHEMVIPAACR